jgi:hypothetical protein
MDDMGKRKVQGRLIHKDCNLMKTFIQMFNLIFLKISGKAARLQHLRMSHPRKNFLTLVGVVLRNWLRLTGHPLHSPDK